MPISLSPNKSLLLSRRLRLGATAALFAFSCLYVQPSPAENATQKAKPNSTKGAAAKSAAAPAAKPESKSTEAAVVSPVKGKKGAFFGDAPAGAKTTDELVKKLETAYKNRDSAAYLSILKAPVRTGIRMEMQFRRESKVPCSNFRYASVAGEADRLKVKAETLTSARENKGVQEVYDVPVCGFVDYDVRNNPQMAPDVIGMPVGKDKGNYFIITRHAVEGTVKPASTAPASGPATGSSTKTGAPAVAPTAAPAKAH